MKHYLFLFLIIALSCLTALGKATIPPKSNSIYHSKTSWENQDNEKVKLSALQGYPVVAAMVYTSCRGSCPLMMNDLKKIENSLSDQEKQKVRFAVFAFDYQNDLPKQLKDFSLKHGVDLKRWTFFHGSASSVRELAALLNVKFKQLPDGSFDHSNLISILDSDGVISHQQMGLNQSPEESVRTLKKLVNSSGS